MECCPTKNRAIGEKKKKQPVDTSYLAVMRRVFGSKRDEMVGGWRKLHNEELDNLYSSPNIIRMIKSRK
jgi:hypothetical protein